MRSAELLTIAEAARELGVDERTARRYCEAGQLGRRLTPPQAARHVYEITRADVSLFQRPSRGRPRKKRDRAMTTTDTVLLTAQDYAALPDLDRPTELVRGEIVEMNPPTPRHGQVCFRTAHITGLYNDEHDEGHVVCNDTGVLTERDPDTVRGPDIWFVSYRKVPKGPLPSRYLDVAPDVAFEIKSPSEIWTDLLAKVAEYLAAGVGVVCVLDPETESARVFYSDRPFEILTGDDELTFPEHLPGFRVPVRRFFE